MINKSHLEQYTAWAREIAALQDELSNPTILTDTVRGSLVDAPYIETDITIRGVDTRGAAKTRAKIAALRAKCAAVERFVEAVEDSDLRTILRLRYLRGFGWGKVMRKMECRMSSDAGRMRVERFFKKI